MKNSKICMCEVMNNISQSVFTEPACEGETTKIVDGHESFTIMKERDMGKAVGLDGVAEWIFREYEALISG